MLLTRTHRAKTLEKCLSTAKEQLRKGTSVVVDATNIGVVVRRKWFAMVSEVVGGENACGIEKEEKGKKKKKKKDKEERTGKILC